MYSRALGGAYLMDGMKGISLHEVVHTVHMTLHMAHLRGQVVDVLITDLAKYFVLLVAGSNCLCLHC